MKITIVEDEDMEEAHRERVTDARERAEMGLNPAPRARPVEDDPEEFARQASTTKEIVIPRSVVNAFMRDAGCSEEEAVALITKPFLQPVGRN